MAGLVPAIPINRALCHPERDRRDKPGDDATTFTPLTDSRLKCSWQHTTSTGTVLNQSFEYCAAIETEAGKSEADAGLQYAQSIFNATLEING